MDWATDNACLSHNSSDLRRIFKYDPRPSRVIKIVSQNGYQAQLWSFESHEDWIQWLDEHIKCPGRGLILILADRTEGGSPHEATYSPMSINDWLVKAEDSLPRIIGTRRATTFAPLGEKSALDQQKHDASPDHMRRSLSIRDLPFAQHTFERICERFQVHDSIVRTLTRSDVPTFSCDSVEMHEEALVYNCRTPNSWASDLALSATHYPQRGLTLALLYGSTFTIEKAILKRLQNISIEASHPLLLPGIFAELELTRHIRLVESSINEVEAKIFELNFQSSNARDHSRSVIESRNESKRTAWLDLTYLRNSLTTWNTQLLKMAEHAEDLNRKGYIIPDNSSPLGPGLLFNKSTPECEEGQLKFSQIIDKERLPIKPLQPKAKASCSELQGSLNYETTIPIDQLRDAEKPESNQDYINISPPYEEDENIYLKQMNKIGAKIKARIGVIRDEYDEKIRDCTMRVDGMAMATQWSQSETAVEVALATNQDSKVMRSISLVTMVFLPGTFFATVFSMTFFDWHDDQGQARVSSYLWIYVVVTVSFTAITIGLWYYFVMFRRTGRMKGDEEEICMK